MDMKKIIASVLAAGALATAGAALAQSLDDRIDRVEARIDQGLDDGTLTSLQAERLRAQVSGVRAERDGLNDSGQLSDWRRQDLNSRLDRVDYEVSRDRYFARYGTFRGYRQDWDWGGDDGGDGGD